MMLGNARVHAVIPITDLDRARDFYEGVLELPVYMEMPDMGTVMYEMGGTYLLIYQRATASSGEHTIAGFQIDDNFDEVIDRLMQRGVTFDTFEIPGVEMDWDERGVLYDGERATAGFQDPDGNVLAIGNDVI